MTMVKEMNGWICHYSHEAVCDGIIGTAKTFEKETGFWIIARVMVLAAAAAAVADVGLMIAITEINGIADKDMGRLNHRQRERGKERKKRRTKKERNVFHVPFSFVYTRQKADKPIENLVSGGVLMIVACVCICSRLIVVQGCADRSHTCHCKHALYTDMKRRHTHIPHTHTQHTTSSYTHTPCGVKTVFHFFERVRFHGYRYGVTFFGTTCLIRYDIEFFPTQQPQQHRNA